jgi:hypothetical protein
VDFLSTLHIDILLWFWATNKPSGLILGIVAALFTALWIIAFIKMNSKKINS